MRNKKKILGIAVLAIIIFTISGAVCITVFWAALCAGFSVGISILISFSPFVGMVVIGGALKIGVDLVFPESDDSYDQRTERKKRRKNK